MIGGFDVDQGCSNDEGGSSGSGLLGVCDEESGVSSQDDETDDENATDIED